MTMPGGHKALKLFIHQTINLDAGRMDRLVDGFTNTHQPEMERLGARLFGIWETSPLNGHWPQATVIWEMDSYAHFAAIGTAQHRDPAGRRAHDAWQGLLGEIGGEGEGRLVHGHSGFKSVEERKAEGFKTTFCIQEVMQTKPGRQRDYVEQLEYAYVPWSENTGKKWLGSFTTVFRYDEVIHYWACDGGWDVFANHFPSWGEKPGDDIKSWMQLAPALRHGWEDSFLQSLPPNPLG